MAKYFNFFPQTPYYKGVNSKSVDTLTNITERFAFEPTFKTNSATYYRYLIKDGDTPENIASKIYGSPERHWVVLAMNDIIDPIFQWPLSQRTIIKFIEAKYIDNASAGQTGLSWATNNIHSYFKVITQTNNSSGTSIKNKLNVDANTYASITETTNNINLVDGSNITISVTKETKTYYDHELEFNEIKRNIILLKPQFIPEVEAEFLRVISDKL